MEELILYYVYYLNDVPTSYIIHIHIYVHIIYNVISCTKYEIWNDIKDKKNSIFHSVDFTYDIVWILL